MFLHISCHFFRTLRTLEVLMSRSVLDTSWMHVSALCTTLVIGAFFLGWWVGALTGSWPRFQTSAAALGYRAYAVSRSACMRHGNNNDQMTSSIAHRHKSPHLGNAGMFGGTMVWRYPSLETHRLRFQHPCYIQVSWYPAEPHGACLVSHCCAGSDFAQPTVQCVPTNLLM